MDVLLAGEPDAGVELAEEEAVVPGLPAVHHLVGVRLVHAVVDALVRAQLAALGLGDPLRAHAPVGGDEGGDGEEEGEEVEADRQQVPAPATRLHGPRGGRCSGAGTTKKFMGARWRGRTSPGCLPNAAGEVRLPFGTAQCPDVSRCVHGGAGRTVRSALSQSVTSPSSVHTCCPTSVLQPMGRHGERI